MVGPESSGPVKPKVNLISKSCMLHREIMMGALPGLVLLFMTGYTAFCTGKFIPGSIHPGYAG
jgi:hypothetical protein